MRSAQPNPRKSSTWWIVAAGLAAGVALTGAMATGPSASSHRDAAIELSAPTLEQNETVLLLAGVSPERLASAGVLHGAVAAIVEDGLAEIATRCSGLEQSLAQYTSARSQYEQLDRLVKGGRATEQQKQDRDTAAQTMQTASAGAQTALLGAIYTASVGSLTTDQVAVLDTLAADGTRILPSEYRTATRSGANWVAPRDALADIRIAARRGEQPQAESVQIVALADSHARVAAAKVGLSSLPLIQATWDIAIGWE